MAADRLRVFFSGMVAGDPHQGGATWAVLQYVLGLQALGHEVFLVEPIAAKSIRPADRPLAASLNAAYFDHVVKRFGLQNHAALLDERTHDTVGLPYAALLAAARSADLLINVSGMLTDARLFDAFQHRVYLDLDPAFNQLWHAVERIDVRFSGHTHFVTVGTAVGTPGCSVPTCGLVWETTLQPVVLEEWPAAPPNSAAPWTTVGNWRGYGSILHQGVHYGQKAHSFRRLIDLPRKTGSRFRLALSIHPAEIDDLAALHRAGWTLVDPVGAAGSPDAYKAFIRQSKGELGIAKSGYVESRCGWFSDRSVCYLASGRPVIALDTGFGCLLPTGEGLMAFTSPDDAIAALETIDSDYERHCRAARALAEQCFASDVVLKRLLDRVGRNSAPAPRKGDESERAGSAALK